MQMKSDLMKQSTTKHPITDHSTMIRSSGEARWVYAAKCSDFETNNVRLVRVEGKQIALFKTNQGYRACDNRCPHEGYPLSQGSISEHSTSAGDCILTCNWHNWKFDLNSGDNLFGGDQLRTYPMEVRDQDIWVDITESPYAEQRATIEKSLREAFDDHEYDRIAREIARLIELGDDPLDVLRLAIQWSWRRLKFGWTHAYAGMADWLVLFDANKIDESKNDVEAQLVCLLESIGHVSYDVLREIEYPYTEDSLNFDEAGFIQAIESEDESLAVAMIRGGLKSGLQFEDFELALSQSALAHYNDFGHSLIYVTKAGELINRLGSVIAEPILISLVRSFVFAAREDKIPEFKAYASTLTVWNSIGNNRVPDNVEFDFNPKQWRTLGIAKALKTTLNCRHQAPEDLYTQWLTVNAINLLSFDIEQQNKVNVSISGNVGWLDFTHAITFANAVRKQCRKFPQLWPQGLLQMACFSGRNVAFTTAEYELERWADTDFNSIFQMIMDHGQDEYIVSVHWLKLALAVKEEVVELPEPQARLLIAALNRFLNSPLKLKQTRRTAHQARLFVSKH
jgi:nitrite reductase/ring-hydroxylating ferredoxin subunit